MKYFKTLGIVLGVLMIVGGLYCLFSPADTYLALAYVIGFSMIVDAVGRLVSWNRYRKAGMADGWMLADAILSLVFGLLLIGDAALQLSVDVFIAYAAAVWVLVHGVIHIIRAVRIHRFHKDWDTVLIGRNWWITLLFGILMALFGVLGLMNPGVIMTAIGIFIGLGIIASGAQMVSAAASIR